MARYICGWFMAMALGLQAILWLWGVRTGQPLEMFFQAEGASSEASEASGEAREGNAEEDVDKLEKCHSKDRNHLQNLLSLPPTQQKYSKYPFWEGLWIPKPKPKNSFRLGVWSCWVWVIFSGVILSSSAQLQRLTSQRHQKVLQLWPLTMIYMK